MTCQGECMRGEHAGTRKLRDLFSDVSPLLSISVSSCGDLCTSARFSITVDKRGSMFPNVSTKAGYVVGVCHICAWTGVNGRMHERGNVRVMIVYGCLF